MGNKVFKALTAVAAAAAAAWLLPKRKKEMAVRPVPAGESMSCIRERTGVNEDALCLYYYRPAGGRKRMPSLLHSMALAGMARNIAKLSGSWRRKEIC